MPTAISTIRGVFHAMGLSLYSGREMMSGIPRGCQGFAARWEAISSMSRSCRCSTTFCTASALSSETVLKS